MHLEPIPLIFSHIIMINRLLIYIIPLYLSLVSNASDLAIVDLRQQDWETNKFVELAGPWKYYESCIDSLCTGGELVDISKARADQMGYPDFGFGTYQLTVLVDHAEELMIKVPDYFSGYEIILNGVKKRHVGKLGKNAETSEPGRRVLYIPIHDLASDTLSIVIPISNFTHQKRGIGNKPIAIGLEQDVMHQKFLDDSYDFFLTGFLILATLFFLGLYFHGKQDYSILFFALFTLSYSYRILGWHNYVLHDLIDMPYHLGIMLEYATFYLCGAFFSLYLESLFPEEAPTKLTRTFTFLSLGWVASTLLPVHIFTQLNTYYLYLLLIGIVLMIVIIIKAALKRRPGSMYSLYGVLGVFIIFSFKTLNYLNAIDENRLVTMAGELTFFMFQALILSRNFTENWRRGKQDAEELAKAKSDFLSVMSHEIRTPLNAVIGTTYHLLDSDPKQEQMEDLKRLKTSSDSLLALINNVLDYNRIESGKLELDYGVSNLKKLCQSQMDVLEPLARAKKLEFRLEYDETLPKNVLIDKTRLSQVLVNLLGNAIKFTVTGSVIFQVSKEGADDEHVNLKFSVIDTGTGISEVERKKIFDAFEQANSSISRKFGGAGLGLAISRKLVELMKGTIEIESMHGVGSKFWFTIPCQIAEKKQHEEVVVEKPKFENIRVLLVEDNPMNILIAKRQLEKWDIAVIVAESGKEALVHMSNLTFDLVLMDLQMPVMDGFEATKQLRLMGFEGPIVALTAASVNMDDLKEKGFNGMLPKPFSPADLEEKLRSFL